VEELLAERGLEVSYETVRRWVLKFGPGFARRLRRSRPWSFASSAGATSARRSG
jgi:transposase-like protein